MSAFDGWFERMMPDAVKYFEDLASEAKPVTGHPDVHPMGDPLNPQGPGTDPFGAAWTRRAEPHPLDAAAISAMSARKLFAYAYVPDELLMDMGVIPDTRPPLPWRWRMRNRISDWRETAARRAYKIIAGGWPDDREDDW
jgi:hypothetical protein